LRSSEQRNQRTLKYHPFEHPVSVGVRRRLDRGHDRVDDACAYECNACRQNAGDQCEQRHPHAETATRRPDELKRTPAIAKYGEKPATDLGLRGDGCSNGMRCHWMNSILGIHFNDVLRRRQWPHYRLKLIEIMCCLSTQFIAREFAGDTQLEGDRLQQPTAVVPSVVLHQLDCVTVRITHECVSEL
jgi:hypothetical protein